MQVKGLSHVCFVVANLERSLDYYERVVGLRHAFDFIREDGTRSGAYVYLGNRTFLELFERKPEADVPTMSHSFQHICIEVANMDETVAALRNRGAEVSESKMGSDGNPQAWLVDPDGNRIELHELRPDGWQEQALWRFERGIGP
ncbi:MAG: VOC family protein [Anaerolineae bacterium]